MSYFQLLMTRPNTIRISASAENLAKIDLHSTVTAIVKSKKKSII